MNQINVWKMTLEKIDKVVDITGLTCPVPLIKTRRALKDSNSSETIKFIGTVQEDISRKEILVALDNMKQEILETKIESDGNWFIIIRKI